MKTIIALAIVFFAGCTQSVNLQPRVAAYGSYAVMEGRRRPPPAVIPVDGCAAGCKCNGTGREPTGDGLSDAECRCPDGCKCKQKSAPASSAPVITGTVCTTGTCAGWPPRNIVR